VKTLDELEDFQKTSIERESVSNVEFTQNYVISLLNEFFGEDIQGLRILSDGCGIGKDVETFVDAGMDAFGIDPGCRIAVWNENKQRGRLGVAYGQALPFPSRHFDAVISLGVLEHVGTFGYPRGKETVPGYVAERLRFIQEIVRVTKPGGCIVLSTPNQHCPVDFWHHSRSSLLRFHWPWETFTVSLGQLKRWFIDCAGCQSLEVLSLENAFAFRQVRRHLLGRMLYLPFRFMLRLIFTRPFRFLSRSFLNPFLIVHVVK